MRSKKYISSLTFFIQLFVSIGRPSIHCSEGLVIVTLWTFFLNAWNKLYIHNYCYHVCKLPYATSLKTVAADAFEITVNDHYHDVIHCIVLCHRLPSWRIRHPILYIPVPAEKCHLKLKKLQQNLTKNATKMQRNANICRRIQNILTYLSWTAYRTRS